MPDDDTTKNDQNDQVGDDTSSSDTEPAPVPPLHLVESEENGIEIGVEQIVEAVLFSSDGPLPASRIASAIGNVTARQIKDAVEQLNCQYQQQNRSFFIQEIARGFQMLTRPQFAEYLQQLYKVRSESKLSAAALETLAVVAYKQPVVRADVEAIRGVASGEMLRSLMEKGLIKIVGRAEELGRPMLYGTTRRFLETFGLRDLKDLPKVAELTMPDDKSDDQDPTEPESDTDETADQGDTEQ